MHPAAGYYLTPLSQTSTIPEASIRLTQNGCTVGFPSGAKCKILLNDNLPYICPEVGEIHLGGTQITEECLLPIQTVLEINQREYILEYHGSPDEQVEHEIYLSATTDPLTGAINSHEFKERAGAEVAFAVRHGSMLSLLTVDIDFLSTINDSLGYEMGDNVIRNVAECIITHKRTEDIFARVHGAHLLLLLRGQTAQCAEAFAQRMVQQIENMTCMHESESNINFTVSIGVCTCDDGASLTLENLIRQSADALHLAKERGRNRVCSTAYCRII